jgi:hypothetical protein
VAQRAGHQAETPPILLPKFPGPALTSLTIVDQRWMPRYFVSENDFEMERRYRPAALPEQSFPLTRTTGLIVH